MMRSHRPRTLLFEVVEPSDRALYSVLLASTHRKVRGIGLCFAHVIQNAVYICIFICIYICTNNYIHICIRGVPRILYKQGFPIGRYYGPLASLKGSELLTPIL